MDKDNAIVYENPDQFDLDALSELFWKGVRELIAQAMEYELRLLESFQGRLTGHELRTMVLYCRHPERDTLYSQINA